MAQGIQKITLNAGRDIPFNKLVLSQQNVRKTKAGVSIEELAEDIAHRGLLTSLNVRAEVDGDGNETGIYRIPAGGRRYRALELLVSQKKLSKTVAIPCIVSKGDTLEVEDSLAENVKRVDLHPLDEFRAIMTLREQGLDEEDIAARFHMSVATVKQRLRLAAVSPRLLEIYANDEMKLGQVMAFSITNDHVRQEQVWDTISRSHNQDTYYIRRMLTETAVRASDRRAVYVGVEAYEAAGGVVMRDLFEPDNGGWLQDPALLEQLVIEKLTADAEALKAEEGWKWVEAAFDFSYGHTSGLRRFYGKQAEYTEDELARHDALKAEYDKLDADYAVTEDYSEETEARLEELGNELDALNDRPYVFDPEDVGRGGAFISLAVNGELKIERGFVRPEDEPAVEVDDGDTADGQGVNDTVAASVNGDVSINGKPAGVEEPEEDDGKLRPLSDRVIEDLTAARTLALRNALANDPVMAFVAALHVAVLKIFYRYGADSCLEITLQYTTFGQTQGLGDTVWAKEIEQRQESWGHDLPANADEVWDYLIALDETSRMALFAHCVSLSVNTTVQAWNRRAKENAHARQLAHSLGFGMVAAGWTPTVDNYLGRVTKAHILQAVREAKGEQSAQLIDHLKKPDMAREAARLLEGSGWLPEVLRLPVAETTMVIDVDVTGNDDGLEDHAAERNDGDLPAFLTEEQDAEEVSSDLDDDGDHLEAAE
ncbi:MULTISPECIES: ParB/RepB/Spo0J family partition protein [Rhizobium/Agrobacterium group]|uniref:ParB/RepB/Spo0J family partition protein n=1 Tax=Rhizobium/Agrobacterium group TaxID=227290 RepID=UPI00107F2D98|nr:MULTISPECIES: ParB/RepB/Spo0J family partition protein [Rhizobium/Agrobacterium group]MBB4402985.1 ParB family chromosome partitioning protein [Agrobacterium radiobacter]MBB5589104.1 ParB family chromosome partitioning protein [Agrobacterium radiobacter]TGE86054.1 DNA-binding protein [Rhizobium sp. SEMIA 4032]